MVCYVGYHPTQQWARMRKQLDARIPTLIRNGIATGHRSLLVLVGDHGRDQVVNLHYLLSQSRVSARPRVLWCYKKELGFTTHRKKREAKIKKKDKNGEPSNDPFELFVGATEIRYCYYKETHKILGQTYGMLVLQDFEALTPNLLARTIETVEGGGVVVLLLRTMTSLRQLYSLGMVSCPLDCLRATAEDQTFRTRIHASVPLQPGKKNPWRGSTNDFCCRSAHHRRACCSTTNSTYCHCHGERTW